MSFIDIMWIIVYLLVSIMLLGIAGPYLLNKYGKFNIEENPNRFLMIGAAGVVLAITVKVVQSLYGPGS